MRYINELVQALDSQSVSQSGFHLTILLLKMYTIHKTSVYGS